MTEATGQRGPFAPVLDRWRQSLQDLGMNDQGLFTVELHCLRCGKVLNADGNHPAEVHAGTSNGLCYGCTAAGPYVIKIYILDGAREVSWPPSCPSYRRSREKFFSYADCENCKGLGVGGRASSLGGGVYRTKCDPCWDRFFGHPARKVAVSYPEMLMRCAQAVYEIKLKKAIGLSPRCSYKRWQAALETYDPALKERIQQDVMSRYKSLRLRHERRVQHSQAWDWREPTADEVRAA